MYLLPTEGPVWKKFRCQRRVLAGRRSNSYLHLKLGIYNEGGNFVVDKDSVVRAGANSAITSLKTKKAPVLLVQSNKQKSYALTDIMARNLRSRSAQELDEKGMPSRLRRALYGNGVT